MALPHPGDPTPPSTDGTPPVPEPPPVLPPAAVLPPRPPVKPASCVLASCVLASCAAASWPPPEPPAGLPPEPGSPPVPGAPPTAEPPPVPYRPPPAGMPPVAKLPPVAQLPPAPLFPPLPKAPPVEGSPPIPPLPPDGALFPPQDGRTTARPDTIIPSKILFIREPPGSSRRESPFMTCDRAASWVQFPPGAVSVHIIEQGYLTDIMSTASWSGPRSTVQTTCFELARIWVMVSRGPCHRNLGLWLLAGTSKSPSTRPQ